MDPKNDIKDEVKAALLKLHEKIDSLKEKVDKLCKSTEDCTVDVRKSSSKEKK